MEYLRSRTADLGQQALDMHRQSLQAMLVHVSRRLPEGERDDRKAEADAAQEARRDQLVAVIQERDAFRRVLDVERATRRRDR